MFSVTKNDIKLDETFYTWDAKTKTFSTDEDDLVFDFSDMSGVTFKTGSGCTFKTGSHCTFKTGSHCTFKTDSCCIFYTCFYCTFDTGSYCTFNTSSECTFDTGSYCTFNTSSDCTFNTGYKCIFNTSSDCTFNVGEDCVIIRRDIFEVIQPEADVKIKLNKCGIKGYTVIEKKHTITIDGKEVEISEESFESLKHSLFEG
jgi:hypothetical protein